jgi:hypothetical protein
MNKAFSVLITFFLIVNYSCKEKIDIEKEKDAVMAVAEEETAAYYANDFERWSTMHIQDSTLITITTSKSGFNVRTGWESYSSNMKPGFEGGKGINREVKTPIIVKIYGESAWVVIDNRTFSEEGKLVNEIIVTNFLEKHDGKWKIAYRNRLDSFTYSQADNFLINSINYAKSLGKSVEDIASFTGDQFKTRWNQANGYNGFVNGMLNNWRSMVPQGELKTLEQDDNHIVFSANTMLTGLKTNPQYNVTYDDYLLCIKVLCEKIADYMGAIYEQETTPDGVLVTITKK